MRNCFDELSADSVPMSNLSLNYVGPTESS